MNLFEEIELIKNHFSNINKAELEEKLNNLGMQEIQSLSQANLEFYNEEVFTEKSVEEISYSNKKNSIYNTNPKSNTYQVNNKLAVEAS